MRDEKEWREHLSGFGEISCHTVRRSVMGPQSKDMEVKLTVGSEEKVWRKCFVRSGAEGPVMPYTDP